MQICSFSVIFVRIFYFLEEISFKMAEFRNHEIFKNVGFDSASQWMFYEDALEPLFKWLTSNITEDNVLTEEEVLHAKELKSKGEYLQGKELDDKLKKLNEKFPGLLEISDEDLERLNLKLEKKKKMKNSYEKLVGEMRNTKANLLKEISNGKAVVCEMEEKEKTIYLEVTEKSKQLQELQKENRKLCQQMSDYFTKPQKPPLFLHQMPVDWYNLKCETFLQYLNLYLKNNYKTVEDSLEEVEDDFPTLEVTTTLDDVGKKLFNTKKKLIDTKMHFYATQNLVEKLNKVDPMHLNLSFLKKETADLKIINGHSIGMKMPTLLENLNIILNKYIQQQIELLLYENTKQKLQRATARLENIRSLEKIISSAIMNAELLWILLQFDIERAQNKYDNSEQLEKESQDCSRRIEYMRQLQKSPSIKSSQSELLIEQIINILKKYSSGTILNNNNNNAQAMRKCLIEYEKISQSVHPMLEALSAKSNYSPILEILNEINSKENVLSSFLYNGPLKKLSLEDVKYLESLFDCQTNIEKNIKFLREIRADYQINISEKMRSDTFWNYSQNLWIWFLTDPPRVLKALQEVKNEASLTANGGFKSLGGIKRI